MVNVIHEESIVKVDLIPRPDTRYARIAFDNRHFIRVLGETVPVISPDDLILAKLDWARDSHSELQIKDVRILLRCEGLDTAYISKWIQQLELQSIWRLILPWRTQTRRSNLKMLLARSGTERLQMASSMYAMAGTLALASLRARHPGVSEAELRGLLFVRFYGEDFSAGERFCLQGDHQI